MLQGWENPSPLALHIATRSDVARLRAGIRADLDKLVPRCNALERALPEQTLRHKGYAISKTRHSFALKLAAADPLPAPAGRAIDPAPAIRHQEWPNSHVALGEMLRRSRRVLCVGDITDRRCETP